MSGKQIWFKQDEIDALDRFIKSLPDETYLKPWLLQVRGEVVAEMRNDMVVSPLIRDACKHCEELITSAKSDAAQIVAKAHQEVAQIQRTRDRELSSIHSAIRTAERALFT